MASRKNFKCCICGLNYPIETMKKQGAKKYCPDCWIKEGQKKEKESEDYKKLFSYIQELLIKNLNPNEKEQDFYGLIAKQISDYKKEYGWTNAGIQKTLKYIYEINDTPPNFIPNKGIALVPYYYPEAAKYFREKYELYLISKKRKEEKIESFPAEIIVINRSDIDRLNEEEKERQLKNCECEEIDLEHLGEDYIYVNIPKDGYWNKNKKGELD